MTDKKKGGVRDERRMEDEQRKAGARREQGKSAREKVEPWRGDFRAAGEMNEGQASEGPPLSGQCVCFDRVCE